MCVCIYIYAGVAARSALFSKAASKAASKAKPPVLARCGCERGVVSMLFSSCYDSLVSAMTCFSSVLCLAARRAAAACAVRQVKQQ